MTAHDFLATLLPASGVIFTASPSEKGWRNIAHDSLDAAVARINHLTFEGQPAYFALATFKQAQYFDEATQKWKRRTQENALALRSYFLDLDVDPADPRKFASKADALLALKEFTRQVGLPRPMLVDSGGGIHAYWPLVHAVDAADWRVVADRFKAVCVALNFKSDMAVPSDQARVLRCVGGYNFKRGAPVTLLSTTTPLGFADFSQRIADCADRLGLSQLSRAPSHGTVWEDDGNLGTTNEPGHFDRILFSCGQLQQQAATRGAGMSEPLWRAGLGIVKFCEPLNDAALLISDRHPEFDPDVTRAKLEHWNAGPTTCEHFHQLNPSTCEACPHWKGITSPIQLGRHIEPAPAPVIATITPLGPQTITLPDPPTGYTRRKDGAIVMEAEDSDGKPVFTVVCPVDLYPISIDRQTGQDNRVSERSWWRAHLPDGNGSLRVDDFEMEAKLLANPRELFAFLLGRGLYMTDDQAKATGRYMSAYLKKMAQEAGRHQLFERLGWQQDRQSFVLGDQVIHSDGRITLHKTPQVIRSITDNKGFNAGTLQGWQQAMQFYNRPGYEAQRFFIYCALGAPLLHMTTAAAKGALVLATGKSGRGKTLAQKACSAIWGHPEAFLINGNRAGSTTNALYSALGTIHSLPFLWDDITQRDADEMRDFMLNVSQGKGKLRLGMNNQISDMVQYWETIALGSANTDVATLLASNGRDADAHLRRLLTIEFSLTDTSPQAKAMADTFSAQLALHHGHVGPLFMHTVLTNYAVVQAEVVKNQAMIDGLLAAEDAAGARFWTAVAAAAYTGAKIAASMGLIQFPVKQDLQWIVAMLRRQCEIVEESSLSAVEVLTNYLNSNLRQTLVISAKGASNIDDIAKEPVDRLTVRNEADAGVIYAEVSAIKKWFIDMGRSFTYDKSVLTAAGIVVDDKARKNIGSGTRYAVNGVVRCWKIDGTKLAGLEALMPATPAPAANVTPMRKKTA